MIWRSSVRRASSRSAALPAIAVVVALAMAACRDNVAPRPVGPALRIVPVADSVFEGDTVRLGAEVVDAAGAVNPAAPVGWTVSDSSLAEVVGDGVLALRRPGTVRVTARSGELAASYDLAIGRLVVRRVELRPDTIRMGRTDRLPVVARILGQGDRSITGRSIAFTSDDSLVAVVSGPPFQGATDAGLLIALGPGSSTIRVTVDGVTGTAHVGVVAVDTTFVLTGYNGSPIPVLVAADSVVINGVKEFDEVYADSGTLVLSGLLQKRYQLDVQYSQYHVFPVADTVQRELRLRLRGEIDFGVVTVAADGGLTLRSEFIGPVLEHTATVQPDGYLVHYRVPGESSFLDLRYSRVTQTVVRR